MTLSENLASDGEKLSTHPWLSTHKPKNSDTTLILGTFPPRRSSESFRMQFFYGNNCRFWELLQAALPAENIFFDSKNGNLDATEKPKVIDWLNKRKIGITDLVFSAKGDEDSKDSTLQVCEWNRDLYNILFNGNIKRIILTSRAESPKSNSAYALLDKWLADSKIIKTSLDTTSNPFIEKMTLTLCSGEVREFEISRLYSPSKIANRGNWGHGYREWQQANLQILDNHRDLYRQHQYALAFNYID